MILFLIFYITVPLKCTMVLWTKENTHFFTNAVNGKSLQDFIIETFYALDKLKAWIGFVMDYYRLSTLYYSFFEYTFPCNYSVEYYFLSNSLIWSISFMPGCAARFVFNTFIITSTCFAPVLPWLFVRISN